MLTRLACLLLFVLLGASTAYSRAADKQPSLHDFAKSVAGRHAYGLYLAGQKMGWMVIELRVETRDGQPVAVVVEDLVMAIAVMGEKNKLAMTSTTTYALTDGGKIIEAREAETEDGKTTRRIAVRKGRGFQLTKIAPDGEKSARRAPMPDDSMADVQRMSQWLRGGPPAGARFIDPVVGWSKKDVNTKEVYTYRGKKKMLWGGVVTEVYQVTIEAEGAKVLAEILADGTPVKGKLSIIDIRAEKESVAKNLKAGNVDMLAASSIFVQTDLDDPERVEAMTLELRGLGDFKLPQSHRQKLRPLGDGRFQLDLRRDFPAKTETRLTPEARRKYLDATPSVQSGDKRIRQIAERVVKDKKSPVEKARSLARFVHNELEKNMAANASTSLDVLKNKAGDCTEHALLLVALARAAGVPAREVGGIAFVNEDQPLFGWHAWTEIHDGRRWVSVDPMWNQVYVDATHVKFSEGADDLSWINVVGALKIKVLDYKQSVR